MSGAGTSASIDEDVTEEPVGCELGTHVYWESRYREEIANFRSHSVIGDVWFGEDSVDRVCNWIGRCDRITRSSAIADLGCGNALVLIELAKIGYTDLHGYDYSSAAVELAREVAASADVRIAFEVRDVLKPDDSIVGRFDVVHDKGTYDAIGLNPDDPRSRCEEYVANVAAMLKHDGLLILTSCNSTESELEEQFGERFELHESIPTAMFEFGGKVGTVATTAVFRKKPTGVGHGTTDS